MQTTWAGFYSLQEFGIDYWQRLWDNAEMKDLIMTGWCGVEFAIMASRTVPIMHRYAQKHGMELAVENLAGPKPPSWEKVSGMIAGLHEYDRVLWIDCDVVIADDQVNLFDEIKDGAVQALVEHDTPDGLVPNCGVWAVTQEMLGVLQEIDDTNHNLNHPWWEQASILEHMGYRVTEEPTATLVAPTLLYKQTQFLSPRWNHQPRDAKKPANARFYHATGYDDRIAFVTAIANATEVVK